MELTAIVPEVFKSAYVTPLLKKPDLDSNDDAVLYRSMPDLSAIAKLLERIVHQQVTEFLSRVASSVDEQDASLDEDDVHSARRRCRKTFSLGAVGAI